MKWTLATLLLLGALIIFGIPSYLGPNDISGCAEPADEGKCQKADAIVAVSGGDTIARTNEAIGLYKSGWAPTLIFSGAAADTTGPSNARAMKRYAMENNIPEKDILIEEFSQTTAENAVNTSLFIRERNIERIILVTSAYHQRRANLEFHIRLGGEVAIVNHPVARDIQWDEWWWVRPSGWGLVLSELTKTGLFYINRGIN